MVGLLSLSLSPSLSLSLSLSLPAPNRTVATLKRGPSLSLPSVPNLSLVMGIAKNCLEGGFEAGWSGRATARDRLRASAADSEGGCEVWEGRVVVISLFKVLQFDILAKFRCNYDEFMAERAKTQESHKQNITQPSRTARCQRQTETAVGEFLSIYAARSAAAPVDSSEGRMIWLEALIELEFLDSSFLSSNLSIRVCRAYPLSEIRQAVAPGLEPLMLSFREPNA